MHTLEEKAQIAEDQAKSKFMKEKQKIQFKEQQLTFQERLAESQARTDTKGHKRIPKAKGNINYSGDKNNFEKYETECLVPTFANKMYISKATKNLAASMHEGFTNCNNDREWRHFTWDSFANILGGQTFLDTYESIPLDNKGLSKIQSYTSMDKVTDDFQSHQSSSDDLQNRICKLLRFQSASNVDIVVFDSKPLSYHFEDIKSPWVRLSKTCIQLPVNARYDTAMNLLRNDLGFGDSYKILQAFCKKIISLPTIKPGDAAGYRKFFKFLIKCKSIAASQYQKEMSKITM